MKDNADIKYNPLKVFVFTLVLSYIIGILFSSNFSMHYLFNAVGACLLFMFLMIFIVSVKMFVAHDETLPPSTPTKKIIKTGIYAYMRNPIYFAFVGFQMSMFLLFENIMYFLSSICLFFWIHFQVIIPEEIYLKEKFGENYERYKTAVPRWFIK